MTTNNATAEEGRNSGASISIATRAGTSEFHGTGFFFLRNEALNSNEWYQNAQKNPKPLIRMNQFGYEMSGPIKKNKTFFLGSYSYNRVDFHAANRSDVWFSYGCTPRRRARVSSGTLCLIPRTRW